MACLAFDEEALNLLRQYHGRKSIPVAIKRAKILRKDNAESLLTDLKNHLVQQNLASALASQMQKLRPVAGASSSNLCPTFELADQSRYWLDDKGFQWRSDTTASEVVDQVYDWCKKGSKEPMQPYVRFSQQMSSLTNNSTESTVAAHFPDCGPMQGEQYVLAARYIAMKCHCRSSQLYIFACMSFPVRWSLRVRKEVLEQAFQRLLKNDLVYLINCKSNSWEDACRNLRTGKLSGNVEHYSIVDKRNTTKAHFERSCNVTRSRNRAFPTTHSVVISISFARVYITFFVYTSADK